MGFVRVLSNDKELTDFIKSQEPDKLTVIDFTSAGCGPCRMISPVYDNLSAQFRHVNFLKADVGTLKDSARNMGIKSMPTFVFFKGSGKVDQFSGADPKRLEETVLKHQGPNNISEDEKGFPPGQVLLNNFIEKKQVECLNQSVDYPVGNIFNKDDTFLQSDCDEQLLMTITFSQVVKLHSIRISAPLENAPKTIRLYVNRTALGFDETESIEATQEMIFTKEDYEPEAKVKPVRFVKFQRVNSLSIFVVDNLSGSDMTQINNLSLIGQAIETTVMSALKKDEH